MKNEDIKQINLDRIKRAAAKLFFNQGIENTTMNQIAAASGVSKVSIYKHFESKYAIVTEICEEYLLRRKLAYTAALTKTDMARWTGAAQMREVLRQFTFVSSDDPLFYSLFVEYNIYLLRHETDHVNIDRLYSQIDAPFHHPFLDALQRGWEDGTIIRGGTPEMLYELIAGAMRGVYMSFFLKYVPNLDEEKFAHLHTQLVLAANAAMALLTGAAEDAPPFLDAHAIAGNREGV